MPLPSNVYESIHSAWAGDTLEGLMDFIRIPAKSRAFNPNWEADGILKRALEDSARWGRRLLPDAEFEIIEKTGIPPALFIRIPASGNHAGKPAFFYGHLDKQPETVGWSEGLGPWTPVLRDGRLYGRGGVDDGYNYYLTLTAVKALKDAGIEHPEIFCLYETDEESGSRDLAQYIQALAPRIGTPAFIAIADLGCNDMKRVWLTQSLRGTVSLTVDVRVLNTPSHSGLASGVVPSSFRIMRALLARIEDAQTASSCCPSSTAKYPQTSSNASALLLKKAMCAHASTGPATRMPKLKPLLKLCLRTLGSPPCAWWVLTACRPATTPATCSVPTPRFVSPSELRLSSTRRLLFRPSFAF